MIESKENNDIFFCYSYRLYHYLLAFRESCIGSSINKNSKQRYWTFKKSKRLDKLIERYNSEKYDI